MEQMIITIGRQFGSAGHEIAQKLADHYELPLYDKNLLKEIAQEKNLNSSVLEEYDEVKRNKFLYRSVRGMNSSPEDNVANLQFEYLRKKAQEGKSFVVVGRCAETILRDYEGVISIFVTGNREIEKARIMELYNLNEKKAEDLIDVNNCRRRQYHDSHCTTKWGEAEVYDLTINSSRLGLDASLEVLTHYIDVRRK
ncbi:MAG: cytidylate kinase-like family protein [Lachnospiraceae bacterium]|nr:cytidylate kinase-like family protein [Lachnospiraceae bacterium]